ncbi:hypothetical protein M6B38_126735 [Iris pallida]|uniref:Uncharacterized protein n=1 Tax=Iris pallida TaxID=29817 RepID=A0AAX6GGS7_IRIPA|nr:hypothetical protein M6B38_126735 [Iris pallida]
MNLRIHLSLLRASPTLLCCFSPCNHNRLLSLCQWRGRGKIAEEVVVRSLLMVMKQSKSSQPLF